jgi:predicted DsbA family dithiol-disulfide isomerase
MIATLLDGDADAAEIRERDATTRARGVTGVPCFVIARQHVVTGAQPPDLWLRVIDELKTLREHTPSAPDAGARQ